ncbi:septum site-determining protein MinC [Paenibacillus filicis]|uniref:Probable septum site-determining protein MinC n=1 Tax=Paenibacillus gyeongsangnamensis TaxID=3388067 RepID=A0ABT4Q915_9BACL|nr:septum site-determining protein MinC [Paenibacillus filicis]MCZ8513350.1 septum site-determining protein MinC [Paenibacillus filicis]
MTATKHHVTIKGVKDGLVFLLDDACEFDVVLAELKHKLEKTHQQILTGPIIHVRVQLGSRPATEEQKGEVREIISRKGNLLVQSIETADSAVQKAEPDPTEVKMVRGMVRSGQTLSHDGPVLFLGDINPGGSIVSTGSIYIMGSLRGMAHAGIDGDETAVIAASHMRPTQLRIAGIISRPPDEWDVSEAYDAYMEFAYIKNGKMEIDKVHHFHKLGLNQIS